MGVSAHFQLHSKSTLEGNLPDHKCVRQHASASHYLLTGSVCLPHVTLNTGSSSNAAHIIGLPEHTEGTAQPVQRGACLCGRGNGICSLSSGKEIPRRSRLGPTAVWGGQAHAEDTLTCDLGEFS